MNSVADDQTAKGGVRLDRWLWAARFFKTRSQAKQAIDSGKVRLDGDRLKPGREVVLGMELVIQQGWDSKTVVVDALSEQRRGAPEAAKLYHETEASLAAREEKALQRKAARDSGWQPPRRPNKKERRQIHRFVRRESES